MELTENELIDREEEVPETAEINDVNNIGGFYNENDDTLTEEPIDLNMDFELNQHFYCAAHRIQLVLKDVFEKNAEMKALRTRVFSVIGKFAKSHLGTARLKELSGKKLLFPANTRWSSLQITYKRILEILPHLNQVAFEFEYGQIARSDVDLLNKIVEIITPFKEFTEALERANSPTISLLLPGLENLLATLNLFVKNRVLPEICNALNTQIRTRFIDVLESGERYSDPVYLCAAILDPSVCHLICHEKRQMAKEAIYEMAKLVASYSERSETSENIAPTPSQSQSQPKSPFGMKVVVRSRENSGQKSGDKLSDELEEYFMSIESIEVETENVLNFWGLHQNKFPILAKVALSVLAIPATTSHVERMFSQLTLHSSGHKSSSGEKRLKTRILMSFNKKFIKI